MLYIISYFVAPIVVGIVLELFDDWWKHRHNKHKHN